MDMLYFVFVVFIIFWFKYIYQWPKRDDWQCFIINLNSLLKKGTFWCSNQHHKLLNLHRFCYTSVSKFLGDTIGYPFIDDIGTITLSFW
jgi:hypothetical protein